MFTLADNAVDVWYTPAASPLRPDKADRYLQILTADERSRHQRFAQEKDRRQYLLGKVLVRSVISRYFPQEPQSWLFNADCFGKPTLANAPPDFRPHFNLSHTEGLVVCVICRNFDVGIDVEHVGRSANMDVARRFCAGGGGLPGSVTPRAPIAGVSPVLDAQGKLRQGARHGLVIAPRAIRVLFGRSSGAQDSI